MHAAIRTIAAGLFTALAASAAHAEPEDVVLRDVAYGDQPRQTLDLFLAPSASAENPSPVILYFHGGGFRKGDKSKVSEKLIAKANAAGVSVAAVNYRFVTTDPLPAAMRDGARAVQYLRAHAGEYGLAHEMGVTGSSAGAGIGLWIAFHDDLVEPESDDPVARESTRVSGAWVKDAQVSYDPAFWLALGLDRLVEARSFPELVGARGETNEGEVKAAIDEASPITHLSSDDPPVRVDYRAGLFIADDTPMNDLLHHPSHGVALQRACEAVGVPCGVYYLGGPRPDETGTDFLIALLTTPR